MDPSRWKLVLFAVALSGGVTATLLAGNGKTDRPAALPPPAQGVAIFAGGCFWCMEPPFEKIPGVQSVTSGYIGGTTRNPTYHEVSAGRTGHVEAVRIVYDPRVVSYERLLEVFWRNVDPLDAGGQFCDRGRQYRTAIFTLGDEQKRLAEASKRTIAARLGEPVATEIVAAGEFYAAEEYHQDFYKKNPMRYSSYRAGCGRDLRLRELWGEAAGH
jgi:methionine-S-sulfoxide reductase